MIDVNAETLLSLSQLAKRLPHRRAGRPVHPSTIHRWRSPGVRHVRLECLRVGGVWCTSVEAFQRFCDRLSEPGADPGPATPGRRPSDRPARADGYHDEVERQLEELGA